MGYAFMSTDKVKTLTHLQGKMKHNYRDIEVPNADPNDWNKNIELLASVRVDYVEAYQSKVEASDYYKDRKVRKDAVKAIEVMMTYSHKDAANVDFEKWKEANANWIKETFGEDNVISLVYHGDEATPHIHGIVIPMVNGSLNCKELLGSRQDFRKRQDSYSKSMAPFGLSRGLNGSKAKHKDIKKYHTELNREAQRTLPPVKIEHGQIESVEEYRKRAEEVYQAANIGNLGKLNKMQRKLDEAYTLAANTRTDAAITIELMKKEHEEEVMDYAERLGRYQQLTEQYGSVENIENQLLFLKNLEVGRVEYQTEHPEKAQLLMDMETSMREVVIWKADRERKKKEEKELRDKKLQR